MGSADAITFTFAQILLVTVWIHCFSPQLEVNSKQVGFIALADNQEKDSTS